MSRCVLAGAVFVLTLAALVTPLAAQPVPPPSEIPLFTQVHGRVVAMHGTWLTLITDDGRRLRVDISGMSPADRRDLALGAPATLIGYVLDSRPNEFVAWFVPVPERETPPAASPAQPDREEPKEPPAPSGR
jgi:hypothetical protein